MSVLQSVRSMKASFLRLEDREADDANNPVKLGCALDCHICCCSPKLDHATRFSSCSAAEVDTSNAFLQCSFMNYHEESVKPVLTSPSGTASEHFIARRLPRRRRPDARTPDETADD